MIVQVFIVSSNERTFLLSFLSIVLFIDTSIVNYIAIASTISDMISIAIYIVIIVIGIGSDPFSMRL